MIVEEPALAYNKRHYTIEEYLALEEAATEKHEYYQGEIFAMAGAKVSHNIVSKNIVSALDGKLRGKPCKPFNSDTRIYVERNSLFTYPDASVICGKPQTMNNDGINVLNPTIIFEVISSSSQSYDRGAKFKLYRDIPSLREYVLIEPDSVSVERYFINVAGNWEIEEHKIIDRVLSLGSIGVSLELKEIYFDTEFNPEVLL